MCNRRECALPKLILMIKVAGESMANLEGSTVTQLEVIEAGLDALASLGVTKEELALAAIQMALESGDLPPMSDVNDDTSMATHDREDAEGETSTHTDTVSGLTFETSGVDNALDSTVASHIRD